MGGLLLAQEGGNTYLPAYDGNGNVHGMIKASDGSLAAAYEYDAFGNTLRESGPYAAGNPFRVSVGQLLAGDDDAPGQPARGQPQGQCPAAPARPALAAETVMNPTPQDLTLCVLSKPGSYNLEVDTGPVAQTLPEKR